MSKQSDKNKYFYISVIGWIVAPWCHIQLHYIFQDLICWQHSGIFSLLLSTNEVIITPAVILPLWAFAILDDPEKATWIQKGNLGWSALVQGNCLNFYDDTTHKSIIGDGHSTSHPSGKNCLSWNSNAYWLYHWLVRHMGLREDGIL